MSVTVRGQRGIAELALEADGTAAAAQRSDAGGVALKDETVKSAEELKTKVNQVKLVLAERHTSARGIEGIFPLTIFFNQRARLDSTCFDQNGSSQDAIVKIL